MQKFFKPLVITSIILIYLIIIAGAVVRMTGSGMGCPDWPKCFGYLIPPTDETQLIWQPNHDYKKGIIIIVNEELRIAPTTFISGTSYSDNNWEPYTEHDYALFNPWHTWIEYINRLVTVISGFPILIMTFFSFWYWKKNKKITLLAIATVFAMGFEAYLGKTVVDTNLLPLKITIHLLMAFVIACILLYLLFLLKDDRKKIETSSQFKQMLVLALILSAIQIIMGTQVRQYVDEQVKLLGSESKHLWLLTPTLLFYAHRSFSISVFLVNAYLAYISHKSNYPFRLIRTMLALILAEILTGILIYYFDFPFLTQPIHLVLAAMLFGVQFYLCLQVFFTPKKPTKIPETRTV